MCSSLRWCCLFPEALVVDKNGFLEWRPTPERPIALTWRLLLQHLERRAAEFYLEAYHFNLCNSGLLMGMNPCCTLKHISRGRRKMANVTSGPQVPRHCRLLAPPLDFPQPEMRLRQQQWLQHRQKHQTVLHEQSRLFAQTHIHTTCFGLGFEANVRSYIYIYTVNVIYTHTIISMTATHVLSISQLLHLPTKCLTAEPRTKDSEPASFARRQGAAELLGVWPKEQPLLSFPLGRFLNTDWEPCRIPPKGWDKWAHRTGFREMNWPSADCGSQQGACKRIPPRPAASWASGSFGPVAPVPIHSATESKSEHSKQSQTKHEVWGLPLELYFMFPNFPLPYWACK